MSVILLAAAQIDALVSWAALAAPQRSGAALHGRWVEFAADPAAFASALADANVRAYCARYAQPRDSVPPYVFSLIPEARDVPIGALAQLLDALEYNSDEAPDWATSDARGVCEYLRKAMLQRLAPSPRRGVWTIDEPAHVQQLASVSAPRRAA